MPHQILYEQDFYQWLKITAKLLRERQFNQLDLENLIEEDAECHVSGKWIEYNNI